MKIHRWIMGILLVSLVAACGPGTHPNSVEPAAGAAVTPTAAAGDSQSALLPTPDPLAQYEDDCVYCFFIGRDPLAPQNDPKTQGFTNSPNDPRKQVTIDETFTVKGGDTFTFDNQIVRIKPHQRADIDIYGTLIIKNSLLLWDQDQNQETRLRINKGGKLIIENSSAFSANQYENNWDFLDGSTISFDHFIGDPWGSIQGSVNFTAVNFSSVRFTLAKNIHNSVIRVTDAHTIWFEIIPPPGDHTITPPAKRHWSDLKITDLWPDTILDVKHSYFYQVDMDAGQDTHLTIVDATDGFGMGWGMGKITPGYINCELNNLGDPNSDTGVLYTEMKWDLPCINSSVTLKNSRLEKVWTSVSGNVHLKISNSNLADPRIWDGSATMEIYNSKIEQLTTAESGKIYVENSTVKWMMTVMDPAARIYGYGILGNPQILELNGGQYIKLDAPGVPWK